ncbi:hypothetical protein [Pinirhizobacter soli]|uniref:hypothetical protein n=1 Tax=Pinirhizobacter soli TaxID=2786953 RepID=UPI00202ABAA0|nr:hypothetical protein [Pinirhizobacter soli]
MTHPETKLYQTAYPAFMAEYEVIASNKFAPSFYDASQAAEDAAWHIPFLGFLIGSELRESLNDIHLLGRQTGDPASLGTDAGQEHAQ